MSQPEPSKPPRWTATAVAFFVIGVLLLVASVPCTATVVVLSITPVLQPGSLFLLIPAALFGGPFILLGLGFIRTGLRERKRGWS